MIKAMTDAVLLVDLDGIIVKVNQSTLSILGYSEKDILEQHIDKFVHTSPDREAEPHANRKMEKRLIDEFLSNIEGFMFPKDGEPIPVSLRSSSIKEELGDMSGIVLVARDLRPTKKLIAEATIAEVERRKAKELKQAYDDLKQLQEQLIQSEKMASLGQIAAGVAHEINNPISGIMVYLHTLVRDIKNGQLDSGQALKFLTDSQDELTRCSRIIKNLLDFSRQSHPKLSPVNLGSILNESFSILDYRAKLQDIEVVQHIDPGLPNIQADADQLKQVFLNLILNAIQAMHQGGRLTIRATKADEVEEITKNLKAVRIDIEDTGCGIAEENIDKVFTPFFTTKKEEEGGVGLGLAVAYGLVKRHGGDIRVVSSREKGATFSVFLRCQEEQEKVNDGGSA
jgi:two-component system NtrC family sensor kinase